MAGERALALVSGRACCLTRGLLAACPRWLVQELAPGSHSFVEGKFKMKRSSSFAKRVSAALLTCCAAVPALAWDGAVTGTVAQYEVVALPNGGTNYDFRVHLAGVSTMCSGGAGSWAYINTSAGNYKAVVAAIVAAHLAGRTATVYTNRGAQNYCQIGHIKVA